jgi:putative FmdB family regulatory protein
MPIYEYEREDGSTFEIIQKSTEALTVCPTTGLKVKRKISPVVSHFKGTGFYQTDYNGGNASAGTRGGTQKSSESSSSSSDSSASSASGTATAPVSAPSKHKGGCGSGGCGCK